MTELDQCQSYMDSFKNGVGRNCTVVSPEELGQEFLYHISVDPGIKKFVPSLTHRTAKKEDRSVPRVSTAPTIFGCLIGYQQDRWDWEDGRTNKKWRDGWYIYGFRNEVCVKPHEKILYDVNATEERWLVPYNSEKWGYKAEIIGKFFYRQVSEVQLNGGATKHIEAYFEVADDASVIFSPGVVLTPGYWMVHFNRWAQLNDKDVIITCSKLTSGEWIKVKGLTADLLSHQEPPSARW